MAVYNTNADTTLISADSTQFTADIDPYALPAPVTKSADDYMALITPWQANRVKARFLATVRSQVQPQADAQAFVASLAQAFDLDEAIGAQLDVDGLWIGRSRNVPTPIPNTFFSWGIQNLGWGQGYWKGPYDSSQGISQLPDDDYRRLLYAKVEANSWDGTSVGALAILLSYFSDPATLVFINDYALAIPYSADNSIFGWHLPGRGWGQGHWKAHFEELKVPDAAPMAYSICIAGKIPSKIDLYLLAADLIPLKAMGVDVDYKVTTVDRAPLFGFGMDNDQVAGWGKGAWAADPIKVASLLP